MSTLFAAPLARLDYRVRIAASLLRAAPRAEHLTVIGMALTSLAAAWPFEGAAYPLVAIPALLALAALIRYHLDGLDVRRDALAAAGANAADSLVIQVAGPFAAISVGAFVGLVAAVALGGSPAHALGPLAAGVVAALLIRRRWLGAPALAAGALGALVTAVIVHATTPDTHLRLAEPRARSATSGLSTLQVVPRAPTLPVVPVAHVSAWAAAWPTALTALLILAATQAAIAKREALIRLARHLAAAAERRLSARGSA